MRPRILKRPTLLIFQQSQSRPIHTKPQNRIYNSVRTKDDFQTLLALSTSNNIPLITFWTASWCPTCKIANPLIHEIIENPDGKYLSKGVKVGLVEVEVDAPDLGYGLGARFMIRSVPTLLAFQRDFPQIDKALSNKHDLTNRQTLIRWIEEVAKEGEKDRKRKGLFGSWFS
ncbi:hypothetical protein EV426DRAFT_709498 [Tirmania nivea]|nr:hypothetical protein EV426DRAFT_709498 [Tirmania nivea]